MVKNLPANAWDLGLIPTCLGATSTEPMPWSPSSTTGEDAAVRTPYTAAGE